MIAVGMVTRNRVNRETFPSTYCEVVYEAKMSKWWKKEHNKDVPVKNKCQFSFYCDGKSDEPKNDKSFRKAVYIARELVTGKQDYSGGALFYHAVYVYPEWASKMKQTVRINKHIFYRER